MPSDEPTTVEAAEAARVPVTEQTPLLGETAQPVPDESEEPEIPLAKEPSTKELLLVLGSIWLGVFLAALDTTIVATLTGPISSSFNSLSLLSWLAASYLISNAAFQPLSGKLTDIYSRRTGLIFSNIFFATGNLICGLASSEWQIVLGRIVAGIGGGGLLAIATFVTSDLIPLRKRGVWQGIGNICYGAGSGLGGVFGGFINDTLGWRWAFLIQVPFIVVSCLLVVFTVKVPVKESDASKLKRIDFLGAITLLITLVLFLLGLNAGGNQVSWTHPLVLTSLPLSVVFLGVFIYIEANVASEPVIPVRLLLDRTVASACLTNWFSTMVIFGLLFYLPLYFQVQGLSATEAGVRLIPYAVGTSLGSLGCGVIMRASGRYKMLNLTSISFLVLSTITISTLTLSTPGWVPFIYLFLLGLAYGSMLTITLVALISAVDHQHHAVVTSASYAFRSTGSTIGIAIASAVFQNLFKSELWSRFGDRDNAHEIISRIRDSLDEIAKLPTDWKFGVLDAYMDSLRAVFLTLFGLGVLGALASLAMREHKLHSNLSYVAADWLNRQTASPSQAANQSHGFPSSPPVTADSSRYRHFLLFLLFALCDIEKEGASASQSLSSSVSVCRTSCGLTVDISTPSKKSVQPTHIRPGGTITSRRGVASWTKRTPKLILSSRFLS